MKWREWTLEPRVSRRFDWLTLMVYSASLAGAMWDYWHESRVTPGSRPPVMLFLLACIAVMSAAALVQSRSASVARTLRMLCWPLLAASVYLFLLAFNDYVKQR